MSGINLSGTIHHVEQLNSLLSESQSKVIKERIDLLEACMGNLCENFGKIARKNARLRDTSDNLVSVLNQYSGKEQINSSTKKGLVNYSSYLSTVEDYRHAMIERVEKKIIQPLSKYQEYLKASRKTIKSTIQIRDKEKQKQQKLNQLMQRQPDDGRNIAQAEANAENASYKVAAQDKLLAEEIDKLEQKKLNDMKNLLKEYTHIQLIFHSKAVEMLTVAYRNLLDIDVENDLEEFRNTFTQSNLPSYDGSKQSLNTSGTSGKNSYENIFGSGSVGGSAPNTPGRNRPGYPPSSSSAAGAANRSRSNENLDRRTDNFTTGGGGLRAGGQGAAGGGGGGGTGAVRQLAASTGPNRRTQYNSAPNLNRAQQNEMEVEDLTDDSDAE